MLDLFLARQPIFDRRDQLVAYELLYRRNPVENAAGTAVSSTRMSSDTLVQSLLTMGMERVTAGKTAFVNVDREMLLADPFDILDANSVVIELLETIACDGATLAAATSLSRRGFTVALDDFVYDGSYDPFLRLASIVKLDVLGRSPEELRAVIERLQPFDVRLLAERVENAEVHRQCAELGFELFQGYFYARPEIMSGRDVPAEQANIIALLNLLRDPEATDVELEEAFRKDLIMTYKLLRIVNSGAFGGIGIESIKHAIRLLGRAALHRWLSLLLISSLASSSEVQNELVVVAMQRARMCELVAEALGRRRERDAAFMVGLFSLLDALMRVPMDEILARINLADELRQVLLKRTGPQAPILRLVEAYEAARWDDVFTEAGALGLPLDQVPGLYADAVVWARKNAEEGEE
ncbi:MAG TPA: EAL domain-containing protein [Gemmatimonadales bacterium]